jgi:hypothetical protein
MAHDHGHSHSHNDYFLEQLFTIGVCGAMGAVGFLLWYNGVLDRTKMLAPSLQWTVVAGSLTLLFLVAVRAIVVWKAVGEVGKTPAHAHDHAHGDCCHGHDHAHHDHAAVGHDHAACGHDHDHDHAHAEKVQSAGAVMAAPTGGVSLPLTVPTVVPAAEKAPVSLPVAASAPAAGHGHDHDHGWAPWRFVVLLLPVVLYMLDLPREGFSDSRVVQVENDTPLLARATSVSAQVGLLASPGGYSPLLALLQCTPVADEPARSESGASQAAVEKGPLDTLVTRKFEEALYGDLDADATPNKMTFQSLSLAATSEENRKLLNGRMVKVSGQFSGNNDRNFTLYRYQLKCCAADALQLTAALVVDYSGYTPDMTTDQKVHLNPAQYRGKWVEVTGRIKFLQQPNGQWASAIIVRPTKQKPLAQVVEKLSADPDPDQ